jgi:hypothetical protein
MRGSFKRAASSSRYPAAASTMASDPMATLEDRHVIESPVHSQREE